MLIDTNHAPQSYFLMVTCAKPRWKIIPAPIQTSHMIRNKSILTLGAFAAMLFLGVGTVIIGAASRNIGLTPSQIGIMVSVQNVGFIISVISVGALSDTFDKARLLAIASLVLAASFFAFYLRDPFALNLLIMLVIGMGIGGYEGASDPLLLDLHQKRQGLFISINHFFVTFGEMLITIYLIFLQFDWRSSMVQSAAIVLVLGLLFGLSRGPEHKTSQESLRSRFNFFRGQRPLVVLFALAACIVGIELSLVGMITSFLMELHAFTQVTSKLGLVAFLGGVAAGRLLLGFFTYKNQILRNLQALFALTAVLLVILLLTTPGTSAMYFLLFLTGVAISIVFPLVITLTGFKYPDLSGTALGIIKLGIPVGGILLPFLISILASTFSFRVSLALFPVFALVGLVLVYANRSLLKIE